MQQAKCKNKAITPYEFILGPIKIKDGLFMGDQLAAKDINFIIGHKVTYIINTVSKNIPNLWQRFGIQYLSVNWSQKQLKIFDKKNNAVNAIYNFIEQAMQKGQSCLVHSINGKSRASVVIIAYLLKKYNWSLKKCVEFLISKKEELTIRPTFMMQLEELEKAISQTYHLSNSWKQWQNQQELILANTFLNAHIPQQKPKQKFKKPTKKVTFIQDRNDSRFLAKSEKKPENSPGSMNIFKPKPIIKQNIQKQYPSDQQTTFQEISPLIKKFKQKSEQENMNRNVPYTSFNNYIRQDPQAQIKKMGQNNQKHMRNNSTSKQKSQNLLNKKATTQSDHYLQVAKLLKTYNSMKNEKLPLQKKNRKQSNRKLFLKSYQKQGDDFYREKQQRSIGYCSKLQLEEHKKKRYPSVSSRYEFFK